MLEVARMGATAPVQQSHQIGERLTASAMAASKAVLKIPQVLVNPAIRFDIASGLVVVQFRNTETGEVKTQYPSERVVSEYRRQAATQGGAETAHVKSRHEAGRTPMPERASEPKTVAVG